MQPTIHLIAFSSTPASGHHRYSSFPRQYSTSSPTANPPQANWDNHISIYTRFQDNKEFEARYEVTASFVATKRWNCAIYGLSKKVKREALGRIVASMA
jgi:hypothetical protein